METWVLKDLSSSLWPQVVCLQWSPCLLHSPHCTVQILGKETLATGSASLQPSCCTYTPMTCPVYQALNEDSGGGCVWEETL